MKGCWVIRRRGRDIGELRFKEGLGGCRRKGGVSSALTARRGDRVKKIARRSGGGMRRDGVWNRSARPPTQWSPCFLYLSFLVVVVCSDVHLSVFDPFVSRTQLNSPHSTLSRLSLPPDTAPYPSYIHPFPLHPCISPQPKPNSTNPCSSKLRRLDSVLPAPGR